MPTKKTTDQIELTFQRLSTERVEFAIIGTTPFIANRVSEKAKRELLWPSLRGTAQKSGVPKHNPIEEYRSAPYRLTRAESPTAIGFPCGGFKAAMATAALEVAGVSKAQVERLVFVDRTSESDLVPIYGVPKLFMRVTRNSDINRTPDVRTRCIVHAWAAVFTVRFVMPRLNAANVGNLLVSAGMVAGLGDWRPEKGGDNGQFEVVNRNDPRFEQIASEGGRVVQERALAEPEPYDTETEDLLDWYESEYLRRMGVTQVPVNGAADEVEAEELEVLA
jgi:hypothetical protein